ncbi:MAG: 5-bromo-4-chloroindolyl phosphate hydrolysis family protein [Clostridia bacterium]|nr:5-bromo-4-chloroindolyl phosphate hydrolysis family protein [Clostridia bacterium]
MKQTEPMVPEGKRAVKRKSTLPVYAVGVFWLVWALILPLHNLLHYIFVAALSGVLFAVLRKILPDIVTYEPIPEVQTGDDVADALLKDGRQRLARIEKNGDCIREEAVRNQVARLELSVDKILDLVEQKPEQAGQLRRFMNYYLPNLEKITDTFALLEEQGVEGENITQAKDSIRQMLDVMEGAFAKQLDALFRHTALDVTSDIFAMQTLMAQEGFAGQQMPQAEEPEADPAPAQDQEIKLQF